MLYLYLLLKCLPFNSWYTDHSLTFTWSFRHTHTQTLKHAHTHTHTHTYLHTLSKYNSWERKGKHSKNKKRVGPLPHLSLLSSHMSSQTSSIEYCCWHEVRREEMEGIILIPKKNEMRNYLTLKLWNWFILSSAEKCTSHFYCIYIGFISPSHQFHIFKIVSKSMFLPTVSHEHHLYKQKKLSGC